MYIIVYFMDIIYIKYILVQQNFSWTMLFMFFFCFLAVFVLIFKFNLENRKENNFLIRV